MKYLKIIFGVLVVIAIAGAYLYPQVQIQAGSAVGTTFNTAKYAAINFTLSSGTSTSIYNSDASDRYAVNLQYQCTGVGSSKTAYTGTGLASVTLQGATTSTSHVNDTATSNTAVTNTNYVFNGTLATSSVTTLVSSSTQSVGGTSLTADWPAGTYLTIFTNATNTAVCTGGVTYIAS